MMRVEYVNGDVDDNNTEMMAHIKITGKNVHHTAATRIDSL